MITSQKNNILSAYLIFLIGSCITFIIQMTWNPTSWISNIYIPDAETMYNELLSIIEKGVSLAQYSTQNEDARIIYFIYQPLYLLVKSPIAFILPNFLMLSVSIFCTYQAFKPFGYKSALFSSLSISANPYLLISITGISKEIPLCTVTSILVLLFRKNTSVRLFLISLLCFVAYGVRPVYGAMLACYFLPCLTLSEEFIVKFKFRIVMIFTPFLFILSFSYLSEYIPLLRRMLTVQQGLDAGTDLGRANLERSISSLEAGGILSCVDLIFRTLSNIFSLNLRPGLMTENNCISLLGTGFWIYGLLISVSLVGTFILSLKLVVNNNMSDIVIKLKMSDYKYMKNLIFSVVFMVPAISLSLIIQPRYLMPILPISMGLLGILPLKNVYRILTLILLISLLGYVYLTFFANVEPIRTIDSAYKPSFVI